MQMSPPLIPISIPASTPTNNMPMVSVLPSNITTVGSGSNVTSQGHMLANDFDLLSLGTSNFRAASFPQPVPFDVGNIAPTQCSSKPQNVSLNANSVNIDFANNCTSSGILDEPSTPTHAPPPPPALQNAPVHLAPVASGEMIFAFHYF